MTEQNTHDRMKRYNLNIFSLIGGVGGAVIGMVTANKNLTPIGKDFYVAGIAILGYSAGLAIDYIKGYFNERLEIKHQRNKQNQLEKNLLQSSRENK
mgnify:CR=1 FL=1